MGSNPFTVRCCGGSWFWLSSSFRIFTLPDSAFSQFSDVGGRLAVSTNGYSTTCGILILLSLMLFALQRRFWLILFAVTGVTMMILSGGKERIASGIISIVLYFLFQKRVLASIGVLRELLLSYRCCRCHTVRKILQQL